VPESLGIEPFAVVPFPLDKHTEARPATKNQYQADRKIRNRSQGVNVDYGPNNDGKG